MSDSDSNPDPSKHGRTEWLFVIGGSLLFTLGFYLTESSLWDSMDYVFFYHPNFQFLHDSIWSGTLPLWNPHVGLGRPFLADTQNAVFYPPMWLVVLGPHVALILLAWMHHVLAFVGMRRLTESAGAEKLPSILASIAFIFSGPFVSRWSSGQIMYCCAIAYMPWLFILARHCFEDFSWRRIAITAGALALQFFCGHPQIFWVTGIGMGLYILGYGLVPFGRESVVHTLKSLGQLALASMWSLAITACVLLPFIQLIDQGNRPDSESFAAFGKMPHGAFLSLFGTLKPLWEYNIFTGWWLAIPGLAGLTMVKNRECRAWLFVAVVSIFVALGDDTPMFTLNYHLLPGFSKMRFVARIAILIPIAVLIAGSIWLSRQENKRASLLRLIAMAGVSLGAVKWLYEKPANPWQLPIEINLLAFGLPALLASIAFPLCISEKRKIALCVIVIGSLIEISSEAWSSKQIYTMENVSGLNPAYPGQVLLARHLEHHFPRKENQPPPRVLINSKAVPENFGMVHGYSTPDAYTSLFLDRPWNYLHDTLGITSPSLANTYLSFDVYKTTPFPWPTIAQDVGFHREHGLINNPSPTPRAYLSFAAHSLPAPTNVLATLVNGHDVYRHSLLETPLPFTLPSHGPLARSIAISSSAV